MGTQKGVKTNNFMPFTISSLGHGVAAAIHDLKVGAKAVETFIEGHQGQIDNDMRDAAAAVTVINPAAGGIATTIDRIGEAVLGEVAAIAKDVAEAPDAKTFVVNLPIEFLPQLKALFAKVSSHPAVQAAPPTA